MKKYLAYYENEWPANITELRAVENKPFVGYLKGGGVKFTVIPKPQLDNEIWYTTSDGNIISPYSGAFEANIVDNTYENGKGVITFDGDVTSIGNKAFKDCSKLNSVTIPNSVTSLGDWAFENCSSLTSMVIPDSVTSIGMHAFYNCSSLTSITIGNSVTSIGYGAFDDCSSLTLVTIPNSVTSIENYAFLDCSRLTSVTIGNSVTSIGKDAFEGCSKLKKTNYTGDIEGWCNIRFDDDSNPMYFSRNFYINDQEIKYLVIPNSVTSIRTRAFERCSSLTSVTIGNSVTSIGDRAFIDCSGLTSITFEGTVEEWNSITKGIGWNIRIPATYVQCSDGQVTL